MANQQPDADSEIEQNQPQPDNSKAEPSAEQKDEQSEENKAFLILRRAVSNEVINQAGSIAKALVESTIKHNSNSARIVVFVIDERNDKKIAITKPKVLDNLTERRSVAMDLAAEPPYTGPDEDGEVPDFFGS